MPSKNMLYRDSRDAIVHGKSRHAQWTGADKLNVALNKLGAGASFTSRGNEKAKSIGMPDVLAASYVFEVFNLVVGWIAVDVVDLLAGRYITEECAGNKPVDFGVAVVAIHPNADGLVPAFPCSLFEYFAGVGRLPGPGPSDLPSVRHLVPALKTWGVFPRFHEEILL
jgi:hypothetical protein